MRSSIRNPLFWKFGLFYYNKKDKRVFPPERYGFGWTVNFANPRSVIAFSVILILIFIIGNCLKSQNKIL
ncbi:hypothetical protein FY557_12755 [Chryseobacterium sp. SN22]|uniref:DUF5808 domain-containing protein n=1 Tax=Chryseobacterium sp. SN22 TaxID=2606431 RepID=UPI0011EBE843|nr:DUF5808 domain-containing protein [Chryseobacterium sp. SN22]KAA0127485.1 hypothetical protein FY557_12755 [Chryseobacterium sp. SN22]